MSNSQADRLAEALQEANDALPKADERETVYCSLRGDHLRMLVAALAKQQASPEAEPQANAFTELRMGGRMQVKPDYSELSREALEQVAARMAQALSHLWPNTPLAPPSQVPAAQSGGEAYKRPMTLRECMEAEEAHLSPEEAAEQIQDAFEAAEKEDDAVRTLIEEGWAWDGDQWQRPALAQGTTPAAGVGEQATGGPIPFKVETWPLDADGFEANLCTECGTPVRYGSRHSKCGQKAMAVERAAAPAPAQANPPETPDSSQRAALQEHADLGQELGEYGGLSDERIAELWDQQYRFHGREPCRVSHLEFARAILAESPRINPVRGARTVQQLAEEAGFWVCDVDGDIRASRTDAIVTPWLERFRELVLAEVGIKEKTNG